jgi:hypothetical protein
MGADRFVGSAMVEGACTGKLSHATAFKAWKLAKRMARKGAMVTPYRCKHCFQWHVGSDGEWSLGRKRGHRAKAKRGGGLR